MTEQDMIAGTKRGDRRSFEALLKAHGAMMAAIVRKWSKTLSKEDLMQTARIAVWRAARRYDASKGASFRRYAERRVRADMRRCVTGWAGDVSLTYKERERNQVCRAVHYDGADINENNAGVDLFAHAGASQEQNAYHREVVAVVHGAIAGLRPRLRDVIEARWLSEDEPLDLDTTASVLGLGSKQHAHSRHKNAIATLRRNRALRALAKEAA